jgi:hypothetical protein
MPIHIFFLSFSKRKKNIVEMFQVNAIAEKTTASTAEE